MPPPCTDIVQRWRREAKDRHIAMLRETLHLALRDGLTSDLRRHAEIVLDATTQHQRDQIGLSPQFPGAVPQSVAVNRSPRITRRAA